MTHIHTKIGKMPVVFDPCPWLRLACPWPWPRLVCHWPWPQKNFKVLGLGLDLKVLGLTITLAWGLLFTCLSTRCLHVEIVTGLDLNNFLLAAFSRFTNLRGSVETIEMTRADFFEARTAYDSIPLAQ